MGSYRLKGLGLRVQGLGFRAGGKLTMNSVKLEPRSFTALLL